MTALKQTAIAPESVANETAGERYLCFTLGKEEFAVPLLSVREVIALPEITPVPQTPPHFLGIMNLRGQVISVMDMRAKLSIKPGVAAETSVVICDIKPNPVGVVVDSINSVVKPTLDEISDKPEVQSSRNTEYIHGVFRQKDHLVLILDIAKTLNLGDQRAIAQGVAQAAVKA